MINIINVEKRDSGHYYEIWEIPKDRKIGELDCHPNGEQILRLEPDNLEIGISTLKVIVQFAESPDFRMPGARW